MTDNFNLIKEALDFSDSDQFYFVQILLRKKEAECTGSNNKHRCLKSYYVSNMDYLDKKEQEIKDLCLLFNARAYIHLTRRSFRDVAMECFENICKRIRYNQFEYVNREYNSACGKCEGKDKTFLVDIDVKDMNLVNEVLNFIENECRPDISGKHILTVPTKHGYHLITKPFDKRTFASMYPDIMVQTNNPTLLYENVK